MVREYDFVKVIIKEICIGNRRFVKYLIPINKIVMELIKKVDKEPIDFKYIALENRTRYCNDLVLRI